MKKVSLVVWNPCCRPHAVAQHSFAKWHCPKKFPSNPSRETKVTQVSNSTSCVSSPILKIEWSFFALLYFLLHMNGQPTSEFIFVHFRLLFDVIQMDMMAIQLWPFHGHTGRWLWCRLLPISSSYPQHCDNKHVLLRSFFENPS